MNNISNSDTFCIAPFIHQSTKTDGKIKLCCRSLPAIGNLSSTTLEEAWNNEIIRKVRLDLVNGIKNERCNICWRHEAGGVTSLRKLYEPETPKNFDLASTMNETGYVKNKVKWLELKLNNICNFSCRMCSPKDSTNWFKDWQHVSKFYNIQGNQEIENLGLTKKAYLGVEKDFVGKLDLSEIEHISFAGGEPLFDKMHYEVLEKCMDRADKIKLSYATNLSMLTLGKHDVLELWKNFKEIEIFVSLDGPKEKNDYIRNGSDWKIIEENIKKLQLAKFNLIIYGKVTLQNTNIYYLPETLEWFNELNIMYQMGYVEYPKWFDARMIPKKLKITISEKLNDAYKKSNDVMLLNAVNYMNSENLYTDELWSKFYKYHEALDKERNQSLTEVFPIFKGFKNE
jgi:MoaA/NifB/PqqE/SkfB family radical SAM enzyme